MICACFGHHDTSEKEYEKIRREVEMLIAQGCSHFYVGHQGNFDRMIRSAIKKAQEKHPLLSYDIVLAYMPGAKGDRLLEDPNTIFPEELALVPPRVAISRRNAWMIDRADVILFYAKHWSGGVGKARDYAERKRKKYFVIS